MAQDQSLFPGRTKGPGLKSPNKLWWEKEITPDLHIAGRLTNRQIKYAEDGGFRSIVSIFTHITEGCFGDDILPTTQNVKEMINTTTKLQFEKVLDAGEKWASVDSVNKLGLILPSLNKPALIFSETGYEATFVVLMHLAKETRNNAEIKINSGRFYQIAAAMGMDFTADQYKQLVSEITGEPVVVAPPTPNTESKDWLGFWHVHPIYKNWFTAGQITKPQYPVVESAGFASVVNIRSGLTFNDKPNQEEVTLLNITENTGTYGKDGVNQLRQVRERLETTRIDSQKSHLYISKQSDTNYESRNEHDFGDDIGYNRDIETEHVKKYPNLQYITLPVVSAEPFTKELYCGYRDRLLEVGKKGPVVVHCAKARRASFLTILAAAEQHNKDLSWALKRSHELGYGVSKEANPVVYETFFAVLGKDSIGST